MPTLPRITVILYSPKKTLVIVGLGTKVLKSHSTSSDSMIRSSSEVIRRNEVCFEHATWRMTENDGQIGLCDVELRGFIYSKVTREDDSGAHSFELNTVKVESLVNNCFFKVDLWREEKWG